MKMENLKMLAVFSIMILIVVAVFVNTNRSIKKTEQIVENTKERIEQIDDVEEIEIISQSIREVSAYNVGDPAQTDDSPCVGAYSKVNLCEEVENGVGVCACNFVPLGTKLIIENGNGWSHECIVWDRMNSRYTNRVDIAMSLDEKERALNFGIQNLIVKIIK